MKRITLLLLVFSNVLIATGQENYHFIQGFENGASDNWADWTTNRGVDGGTGVAKSGAKISGSYGAKFRGGTASITTDLDYVAAGELYFSMKKSADAPGSIFSIYTSIDGGGNWTLIWSITQENLGGDVIRDSMLTINSGNDRVKLKFESTNASAAPFILDDVKLSIGAVSDNNTDLSSITVSGNTVSHEELVLTKNEDGVFVSNDSVAFNAEVEYTAVPLNANASWSVTDISPLKPGASDTAVITVTSADGTQTADYKAVVMRSIYHCKIGFLVSGNGNVSGVLPPGWAYGGSIYAANSKGDYGLYPGNNGMRLYNNGSITTPIISSVGSVSFATKFSVTDNESLGLFKSTDSGESWELVKTYLPTDPSVPAYPDETSDGILIMQDPVEINESDVMIRFQMTGGNSNTRIMIDDIGITGIFNEDQNYSVTFTLKDIGGNPIDGATVTLGDDSQNSLNGAAEFSTVPVAVNIPYIISKTDDYTVVTGTLSVTHKDISRSVVLIPEMDIFLALGQSNMAGRAPIEPSVEGVIENVKLLADNNTWVDASNPMNIYSTVRKDNASIQKVGPSYSFAKAMARHTDKMIGLVVNARGGTSITEFSEGGTYYTANKDRIAEAKSFGKVKGIIWHQGESDNSDSDYLIKLNTLVTDYRTELEDNVFFVAGQLGGWTSDGGTTPKYNNFNTIIPNISSVVSYSDYVVNDELTHVGDYAHFDLPSQILLGQRYAKKMLAEIYNIEISIVNISVSGDGFVLITEEEKEISSIDDFSYTYETGSAVVFDVEAGEGRMFSSLTINGTDITAATGMGSYTFAHTAAGDTSINVVMETEYVKVDQTITFDDIDDKTYGDPVFSLSAKASSGLDVEYLVVSGMAEISGADVTINGAGEVIIEANQSGNNQYRPAPMVQKQFTVNKAQLEVTANDTTKSEGEANPQFRLSFVGFVNGEDLTVIDDLPIANCSADEFSQPGNYDIMVSGGSDNNYSFTFVNGVLSITDALGIRRQDVSPKVYPNPTTDILVIENFANIEIQSIEVFNVQGSTLYKDNTGQLLIDVSSFPKGTFILNINKSYSRSFIKE